MPFTLWFDNVVDQLNEFGYPLPLTDKEIEWMEDVWEHFYMSPVEAALLFINEYER
ncbi:hypothetical protein GO755_20580 [Spirosoma sp. HMF4905]|uniref:Uncharacterized protein n=1 Tax=Spirosoma arboris TaxID=2682092 RepID=A0A7K1SFC9_9BACT|nr:hypothetical protein [Spirosoma arboris]MVM32453.1 hypothetical protein [Spirosoma arboris]